MSEKSYCKGEGCVTKSASMSVENQSIHTKQALILVTSDGLPFGREVIPPMQSAWSLEQEWCVS